MGFPPSLTILVSAVLFQAFGNSEGSDFPRTWKYKQHDELWYLERGYDWYPSSQCIEADQLTAQMLRQFETILVGDWWRLRISRLGARQKRLRGA